MQAAWLYAQMIRWGQAQLGPEALKVAKGVFRPDLYDSALALEGSPRQGAAAAVGAFAGPEFDADNLASYLAALPIARRPV